MKNSFYKGIYLLYEDGPLIRNWQWRPIRLYYHGGWQVNLGRVFLDIAHQESQLANQIARRSFYEGFVQPPWPRLFDEAKPTVSVFQKWFQLLCAGVPRGFPRRYTSRDVSGSQTWSIAWCQTVHGGKFIITHPDGHSYGYRFAFIGTPVILHPYPPPPRFPSIMGSESLGNAFFKTTQTQKQGLTWPLINHKTYLVVMCSEYHAWYFH